MDISVIKPGVFLHKDGHYFLYKGLAPDGRPRAVPMDKPPHGRTVYTLTDDGRIAGAQRLPSHVSAPVLTLTALSTAAALAALGLATAEGETAFLALLAAVAAVVLALAALLTHTSHLHPVDEWDVWEAQCQASWDAWHEQQRAVSAAADAARRASAHAEQWQRAVWGQQAAVNAALNPGGDVWRPFGQSPPM